MGPGMHRFFLMAVFCMVSCFSGMAHADYETACADEKDTVLKIKNCTAAIESGQWSGPNLAWAYSNRGLGYRRQGDLEQALVDYNEAIRLRPNYPDAYGNRAYLLDLMGRYDEAITDWETALRQGGPDRVKRAQKYLQDKGFYKGKIDGKYGPNSRKALRACVYDVNC